MLQNNLCDWVLLRLRTNTVASPRRWSSMIVFLFHANGRHTLSPADPGSPFAPGSPGEPSSPCEMTEIMTELQALFFFFFTCLVLNYVLHF